MTLEPGRQYYDNWHIQAICEHLEAVVSHDIRRLIINIPPRHMKSLLCSVAFPTWAWIHKPHLQFLFASYNSALSIRDSIKCRRLITSQWYQDNWDDKFQLTSDQNQKQRYENDKNGHRIALSVNSGITGEGGDVIVIDDPHSVKEAESDTVRASTCEWFDTAVPSRINDPKTGAFVIIMQRVHSSDLTGHILDRTKEIREDTETEPDEWTHICVPAEFEAKHPHKYFTSLITASHTEDPRTKEGELLWFDRFDKRSLDNLKTSLGSYASAGQLQQRPSPKGGGIIKKSWWREWDPDRPIPEFLYVLQSWDTAFEAGDDAAYSAMTSWGVFAYGGTYHIMLKSRWRDRVEYPALLHTAREKYADEQPDAVLIEKKSSGHSLVQSMRLKGIPVLTYSPDRDKVARAHAASVLIEGQTVWHPRRRWATEVIDHCAVFPAGDGADIVDTVTQALLKLRNMWYGAPTEDEEFDPEMKEREDPLSNVVNFPEGEAIYG